MFYTLHNAHCHYFKYHNWFANPIEWDTDNTLIQNGHESVL